MQENEFVKVYKSPYIINGMFYYVMSKMSDAKHGHSVKLDDEAIKDACKKLKIKEKEVINEIKELEICTFLIRLKNSSYYVNPYYVGKGEWKDIAFLPKFMVVEQVTSKIILEDMDIDEDLPKKVTEENLNFVSNMRVQGEDSVEPSIEEEFSDFDYIKETVIK